MTEEEWLAATNPEPKLTFMSGKVSDRKLQLFACACARRVDYLVKGDIYRRAVETVERYSDGCKDITRDDMYYLENDGVAYAKGISEAEWPSGWSASEMAEYYASIAASDCARLGSIAGGWAGQASWIAIACLDAIGYLSGKDMSEAGRRDLCPEEVAERTAQDVLLKDITGNPFRPVALDPAWLTATVTALAAGIYADRAFDRLPILADALEEAGCDNADVLSHCRGPGPHVRGCWVVDLVLGKA